MAAANASGELYTDKLIALLEVVWGKGWLSPGGPEELALLLEGVNLNGKTVLDIGCGAGGLDVLLVQTYGAAYVTGIDVEDGVLERANATATAADARDRCGFAKVRPGPLPLPPETFDIVFSKDSIVHIADKHALLADVARILKPRGMFVASDWLIGHEGEPSSEMRDYISAEGLDFGMASPARYGDAMQAAGFTDIRISSRNAWYRDRALKEVEAMAGPLYAEAVSKVGAEFVDANIALWRKMLRVLESGEHCPAHLRATKPAGRS